MNRNAGRGTRHATAVFALALAMGACTRQKPGTDSVDAAARAEQPAETPEAIAQKARADSARNAAAGVTQSVGAKTESTANKTKFLGRDSVRQGPIVGVPSIVDTAKRRPPR